MSEVWWGLVGQALEPSESCQERGSFRTGQHCSTEWRRLSNSHIWSEYAEVADMGCQGVGI